MAPRRRSSSTYRVRTDDLARLFYDTTHDEMNLAPTRANDVAAREVLADALEERGMGKIAREGLTHHLQSLDLYTIVHGQPLLAAFGETLTSPRPVRVLKVRKGINSKRGPFLKKGEEGFAEAWSLRDGRACQDGGFSTLGERTFRVRKTLTHDPDGTSVWYRETALLSIDAKSIAAERAEPRAKKSA